MKLGGGLQPAQGRFGIAHLKGRRLALAEETFVGLCQSVAETLGLTTPRAVA